MKICKNCQKEIPAYQEVEGQLKQLTSRSYCLECSPFGKRNTRRIHIQREQISQKHCVECGREYPWNKNNVCSTCRTFKRRESQRNKAISYRGGKCLLCENDDHDVLTFHHKDPKEKKFNLCGSWQKKWHILKEELDKCEILCANCHIKLHRRQNNKKMQDVFLQQYIQSGVLTNELF